MSEAPKPEPIGIVNTIDGYAEGEFTPMIYETPIGDYRGFETLEPTFEAEARALRDIADRTGWDIDVDMKGTRPAAKRVMFNQRWNSQRDA